MGNRNARVGSITSQMPLRTAIASSVKLTAFCPRYVIGRVGSTSCSLPAAMRLPVQVRNPSSTSATIAAVRNCVRSPSPSHR
jgi:hypothetical protein